MHRAFIGSGGFSSYSSSVPTRIETRGRLLVFSKLIRRVHMYLALFLVPWVCMYAVSTLAMNHRLHFEQLYETARSSWRVERELEHDRDYGDDADRDEVAQQILTELGMQGRHQVRGGLEEGQLTILRQETFAPRRIKYSVADRRLVIERRESRAHEWLNALHARRGYDHGYAADTGWAVSVDVTITAILFWALSGLWLWWSIPKTRWWGSLCLFIGIGSFCLLLATT